MSGKKINLTANMEDYLETIALLIKAKGVARVNEIGQMMKVKNPSVNNAMKNLAEQGLINHEKYGCIDLTAKGAKAAQAVQERHDLLTRFLVEILQVDRKTAVEDACKMEHVISQLTYDRLSAFLQYLDINLKDKSEWLNVFSINLDKTEIK